MILLKKIFRLFSNKFVIVTLVFLVWITFFDNSNLIKRFSDNKQLNKLKKEKASYKQEVYNDSVFINELSNDDEVFERYAREKYFMKKDSEDIYVVVKENENSDKDK
ncbi:MAG: septum formation initiator family protein [Bacteroidales bacterium]|nr:septum formation initiator family protein [Bacteroidales bacterium]